MSKFQSGHIMRISQGQVERQLFLQRELFVGIKRNWATDSRIIFIKKFAESSVNRGDWFVASGIVERFVKLEELTSAEAHKCEENNWYGKIVFSLITKLLPPVSAESARLPQVHTRDLSNLAHAERFVLQTGMPIDTAEVERIEAMANVRITF
jgi:hypothetical protein